MRIASIAAVVGVIVPALAASATDIYVAPDGATFNTPTAPYNSWEKAADSLHDIETMLADAMTVHLTNGIYGTTNCITVTTATTIIGEGMSKTIVQNKQTGRVDAANVSNSKMHVFTVNNKDARLEGFVITGGIRRSGKTGGGVQLNAGKLLRCCIRNNGATLTNGQGHGVYMSSADAYVSHCVITNNSGNGAGAGIYMTAGTVENSLIANNKNTVNDGAGIWFAGGTLRNCTVVGNITVNTKNIGGNLHFATTSGTIGNCLFANATAVAAYGVGAPEWTMASTTTAYYTALTNNISHCAFAIPSGATDIGHPGDGSFAFTAEFSDADYHVPASSSAVGSGYVYDGIAATDLDGNDRVINGKVDIGCYQNTDVSFAVTPVVTPSVALAGSDITFTAETANEPEGPIEFVWTLAANTLNNPITLNGKSVTTNLDVAGHYNITLAATGAEPVTKTDSLHIGAWTNYLVAGSSEHTAALPYDSWANAATNVEDVFNEALDGATVIVGPGTYYTKANRTLNDAIKVIGVNGAEATAFLNGQGEGSGSVGYRVFTLNNSGALLKGLTIAGGWGRAGMSGGGVLISTKGGTVEDCIIRDNFIGGGVVCAGGGAAILSSAGVLRRCVIRNNSATYASVGHGGGVHLSGGQLEDCLVASNAALSVGGVHITGGSAANCTVVRNWTTGNYGAMYESCGGIYLEGGIVSNMLAALNTACSTNGVGSPEIMFASGMAPKFVRCGLMSPASVPNATCIATNEANLGFVDAANGNYRLVKRTPFYKQGYYDASWMDDATDLDGRPRASVRTSNKKLVDIGCYESAWIPYGMTIFIR